MDLFPKNVHPAERAIRAAVGILLLALVFVGPQTPWGWIGLIPLATSVWGTCPLYTVLHLSTLGKAR